MKIILLNLKLTVHEPVLLNTLGDASESFKALVKFSGLVKIYVWGN
jgi:hypothetical protein